MADNTPSDVPPIPIPPIVDLAGTGAAPDDATVVRPRKKAEPKVVPPAVAPAEPVAAAPVVAPVEPTPVVAPVVATPDPYAQPATPPPAAPNPYAAQPNPYAQPAAAQPNPYGAPQAPQPYAYGPYVPQPPKGMAIASMALGIGGLFFSFVGWGFLIVLAAVILGHISYKRQPHAKGFALTGIITGYVGILFNLLWGLFWIAIFATGSQYS